MLRKKASRKHRLSLRIAIGILYISWYIVYFCSFIGKDMKEGITKNQIDFLCNEEKMLLIQLQAV